MILFLPILNPICILYYINKNIYNDLINKPTIPSTTGLATEKYVDNKVSAIVIPTVPTKVSAFENDKGYLTEHQSLDLYAKKSEIPTIPTKISDFENDIGYLT